jgi:hypothetical protein
MNIYDNDERMPQAKKDSFLLISNIVLVLAAAIFIYIAFYSYQKRVEAITLSESRFLTTEWRLLQQLKVQTDQKLLEKELEIEELNRRYMKLAEGNASAWELRQFEIRIEQAKAEREEILSHSLAPTSETGPKQTAWLSELLPSGNQSVLTVLYQKQIEALKGRLQESSQYIELLEKKFAASNEKQKELYMNAIAEDLTRIKKLSAALTGTNDAIRSELEDMKHKAEEIDEAAHPRIEDINTRALIRAIVSSASIRAEYPDLLKSLDRYFEVYGLGERLKGRKEAYIDTTKKLEPLVKNQ